MGMAATGMLHPTVAAKPGQGRRGGGGNLGAGGRPWVRAHAANLPCKFLLPGVSDPRPRHLPGHGGGSKPARASPAPALGQLGYFGFTNLMGALGKERGVGEEGGWWCSVDFSLIFFFFFSFRWPKKSPFCI